MTVALKARFAAIGGAFDEHVRDWQVHRLAVAALAMRMAAFRKRPAADPTRLNREEQKRLIKAEAELKAAVLLDDKRAARDKIMAIHEAREIRAEQARQAADTAETQELEAARGSPVGFETVERAEWLVGEDGVRVIENGRAILQVKKVTRLRVLTRDGLDALTKLRRNKAGRVVGIPALTKVLHAAALQYRKDYEDLDPEKGLRPPRLDGDVVSGGGGGETWAETLRDKSRAMAALERAIQAEDRTYQGSGALKAINRTGRAVFALREVAGKGNSIASLGRGDAQRLNRDALVLALEIVADRYGLQ